MKTRPTGISVHLFLKTVSDKRSQEANILIALMQKITGQKPYMWGPSMIGFGSQHYKYDSGREGDMPQLAFSPSKASLTIYFSEGFDRYADELKRLGTCKQSVSCLYIQKLADVDIDVLRIMLEKSYTLAVTTSSKLTTVDEYIASIPPASLAKFNELRQIVTDVVPHAKEVLSYAIIGYKIDDKHARVYISGWKDHVAMYPVPRDKELQSKLAPYIKGKGTLWFNLDEPLPKSLIEEATKALVS